MGLFWTRAALSLSSGPLRPPPHDSASAVSTEGMAANETQILTNSAKFCFFSKKHARLDIPGKINSQTTPWITHPIFILGTV